MSKTKKIRQVYALLNAHAPIGFRDQGQLLCNASSLVNLFEETTDEPQFELRTGGRPFDQWASDLVLKTQPWRLAHEELCGSEMFDTEDERYTETFARVKYLLEYEV